MYDVAAIKSAARAAGHNVRSVRNSRGSLRGSVTIHLAGRWDDDSRDAQAIRLSEWLRATYPRIRFVGNDVMPAEFCAYWMAREVAA